MFLHYTSSCVYLRFSYLVERAREASNLSICCERDRNGPGRAAAGDMLLRCMDDAFITVDRGHEPERLKELKRVYSLRRD